MSKTFTYTKVTSEYYLPYTDDWEQDGVDFHYEVSDEDLLPKVVDLVFDEFFYSKKTTDDTDLRKTLRESIKNFINRTDVLGQLIEVYEEDLKEIFKNEAFDNYNGRC